MRTLARPTFIILLIIASTTIGLAQSKPDTLPNRVWLSPIRLADLVNPGLELGYEYRYSPKLSLQFAGAYLNDLFSVTPFGKFKGYRFALEQKVFVDRRRYFAVEAVYYRSNYRYDATFENGVYIDKYIPETYPDEIGIHKRMLIFNLKAGLQKAYGRFMLNFDVGLGIKFKNITHSDRLNPADTMLRPRHPNAYHMATEAGKKVGISVPMNFKVGYRL